MNKKGNLPITVSSETQSPSPTTEDIHSHGRGVVRRRSFLKRLGMAGATLDEEWENTFRRWYPDYRYIRDSKLYAVDQCRI
jgi:hypothetical protein